MARSKTIRPRTNIPDPKFANRTVAKLINRAMKSGKKTVAQAQVYEALDLVSQKTKQDALEVLDLALKNIVPQMEVRSAYQVPTPVRTNRGTSLAVRWLVSEAGKRPNREFHTFSEKLAAELLDAVNGEGGAVQKKINSHKMAEANKAFAHFRW